MRVYCARLFQVVRSKTHWQKLLKRLFDVIIGAFSHDNQNFPGISKLAHHLAANTTWRTVIAVNPIRTTYNRYRDKTFLPAGNRMDYRRSLRTGSGRK